MESPTVVETLVNQHIVFTGKVLVDGEWEFREKCGQLARAHRASEIKDAMSRYVSLVVYGDLASQHVTDAKSGFSRKLLTALKLALRKRECTTVNFGSGESLPG